MLKIKALVLCAGKSTRIASIGKGLPKPLIELGGTSVLVRNLRWLSQSGIEDIWINLHYRPDEIQSHITSQFDLPVKYIYEPEILGTAGAVKNLCKEWTEAFLVICGDNVFNFSLLSLYRFHQHSHSLATLALFDREKSPHTGIAGGQVVLAGPRIEKFVEGSADRVSPYVNAGAYFLEPKIVDYIPSQTMVDFGKDVFPQLLQKNIPLAGHVIDGYCLGIDTPEAYYKALEILNL